MTLVLAFAATLLVAVLVSARAERTVLSTSVLFLAAGLVLGWSGVGPNAAGAPGHTLLARTTELALFIVLSTDGMRLVALVAGAIGSLLVLGLAGGGGKEESR